MIMSDQTDIPQFTIACQYVKDLSFEAPRLGTQLRDIKTPPQIALAVEVGAAALETGGHEATLHITAKAESGNETLFLCDVVYAGVVLTDAKNEALDALLYKETPRLLFPFVRSLVAGITRESGLPPLVMVPIDFDSLYRNREEQNLTPQ